MLLCCVILCHYRSLCFDIVILFVCLFCFLSRGKWEWSRMRGEVWIKEQLGGEGGETTIMIYYMRKNIFLVKTKKASKIIQNLKKAWSHSMLWNWELRLFFRQILILLILKSSTNDILKNHGKSFIFKNNDINQKDYQFKVVQNC